MTIGIKRDVTIPFVIELYDCMHWHTIQFYIHSRIHRKFTHVFQM